jgi:hypothetical protein
MVLNRFSVINCQLYITKVCGFYGSLDNDIVHPMVIQVDSTT